MSNHYIGMRYVPKVLGDDAPWSIDNSYEQLTVVVNQGNSYTSRKAVPVGIDISNKDYWTCTGNYNAQIEQYRTETNNAVQTVNTKLSGFENEQDGKFSIMLDNYKTQINSYADGKYADINADITATNNNLQNTKDEITASMASMETNLQNTVSGYQTTAENQMAEVQTMIQSIDIVFDEGTSTDVDGSDITIIEGGEIV
jgi:hypothetical protein